MLCCLHAVLRPDAIASTLMLFLMIGQTHLNCKLCGSTAAGHVHRNSCQQRCYDVAGHLQQLDLTSAFLNCSFPMSVLSQFTSLENVLLSSNPDLKVSSLFFSEQLWCQQHCAYIHT